MSGEPEASQRRLAAILSMNAVGRQHGDAALGRDGALRESLRLHQEMGAAGHAERLEREPASC